MEKSSAYRVRLAALAEGRHEREFVCDTAFFRGMESAEVLEADVTATLVLTHRNGVYDCEFLFRGSVQVPCDRCLEPLDVDIDTRYHVAVRYGEEYDDSDDEALVIPDTMTELDVSGMLHDTILLAIPMRRVHEAGGCDSSMSAMLGEHAAAPEEEQEE